MIGPTVAWKRDFFYAHAPSHFPKSSSVTFPKSISRRTDPKATEISAPEWLCQIFYEQCQHAFLMYVGSQVKQDSKVHLIANLTQEQVSL